MNEPSLSTGSVTWSNCVPFSSVIVIITLPDVIGLVGSSLSVTVPVIWAVSLTFTSAMSLRVTVTSLLTMFTRVILLLAL